MTWKELKGYIKSDLYRYGGSCDIKSMIKAYILIPRFRFTFWFRFSTYMSNDRFKVGGVISYFILNHYSYLYGINIQRNTKIKPGLYIGHFSGIVVSSGAVIGKNCNISQGVTIGVSGRGEKRGAPVLGDNVYIGAGAKLIGKIMIGNNVAIGANAVVAKDISDNSVVAGIPARIISMNGSHDFIDYAV